MPVESQFIGQKDKTWTANSPLFVAHGTTLYIENRTIFSNHTKLNWKDEKEKIKKKLSEKLETFVNRMASNEPCLLWCTVVPSWYYQRCNIFFPSSYVRFPFSFDRTLVVVLWVLRVIRVCSVKVKNCFRNSMKIFKQLHIIIYMQMDVCVGCIEVFHIKSKGTFSFGHGFNIMPDFQLVLRTFFFSLSPYIHYFVVI